MAFSLWQVLRLRQLSLPPRAKSDADVLAVRPILQHPNVTLMTNACAIKLGDRSGRQRGDRR